MKNIFKILTGTLLGLALLTSCSKDNEQDMLGSDVNTGVGFLQSKQASELDPSDPNAAISITLVRSNAASSETFSLILSDESHDFTGIFNIPLSVTFEQGKNSVELVIPAIASAMAPGVTYEFNLALQYDGDNISAVKAIDITSKVKLAWEDVGVGEYDPALFTGTWDVTLQKAIGLNFYRLVSPIEDDFNFEFTVNADNTITFSKQQTGYVNGANGMIWYTQSATIPSTFDGNKTYTFGVQYTNGGTGSYGHFTDTFVLD